MDLYNAASFVLQGSASAALLMLLPLGLVLLEVKTETLLEIQALKTTFTEFMEMFKNLLQQSSQRSPGPPPTHPLGEVTSKCNFCGVSRHFMRKCKVAAEYMPFGKCKCNVKGKIVLSARGVVPQHITEVWHHWINPRQITAAQMLMEMAALIAQRMLTLPEASQFSISKWYALIQKWGNQESSPISDSSSQACQYPAKEKSLKV